MEMISKLLSHLSSNVFTENWPRNQEQKIENDNVRFSLSNNSSFSSYISLAQELNEIMFIFNGKMNA